MYNAVVRSLLLYLLFFPFSTSFATSKTTLNVVTSIKPLYGITQFLMQGVGTPHLLLNTTTSPHTYRLRPSQIKILHSADLIIWISPQIESFLQKPLSQLDNSKQLQLINEKSMHRLPARQGGEWSHSHHEHEHHDLHEKEAIHIDPHLWLSPKNGIQIAQSISAHLQQHDPKNETIYQKNTLQFIKIVEGINTELTQQLASVRAQPFLVFHDAYQYFEQAYQLNAVGTITISPEQNPSAKRLHKLKQRIQTMQVSCLFAEPQFKNKIVKLLHQETQIKTAWLDPIGTNLATDKNSYFELLRHLSLQIKNCLQ